MRYLKVFAQDLTGDGRADTVLLQFYQSIPGIQDRLVNHAVAYDFPTDGKIDYSRGDVTNNGRENSLDRVLLDRFATAYLKLNWDEPETITPSSARQSARNRSKPWRSNSLLIDD